MKKHLLLALSAIVICLTSCEKGTKNDPIENSNVLYTEVTINFDHEYEYIEVRSYYYGENWEAHSDDFFMDFGKGSTVTFNFPTKLSYWGNPVLPEKSPIYLEAGASDTYTSWKENTISDIKDYSKVTLHAPDGGGKLIITDGVKR